MTRPEVIGLDDLLNAGRSTARPDPLDFRDLRYEPGLRALPRARPLERYLEAAAPVLDQGPDGACTGFALATVAHHLLLRRDGAAAPVSAAMLFAMAKRYDEYVGTGAMSYGSSLRAAVKGWHHHGACSAALWPYTAEADRAGLDAARTADAAHRPLGAYYRVDHRDLAAIHCALNEVGVLAASVLLHPGWAGAAVAETGHVRWDAGATDGPLLGHAVTLVGYDEGGFWFQNSYGVDWGRGGFGHLSYDDWLNHGMDVWACQLAVPVSLRGPERSAARRAASEAELRPHVVRVGDDGHLLEDASFGTSPAELVALLEEDLPWRSGGGAGPRRILVLVPGALGSPEGQEAWAAEVVPLLRERGVYPLVLLGESDHRGGLEGALERAWRGIGGGVDATRPPHRRLDDSLEAAVRRLGGRAAWKFTTWGATAATAQPDGAARLLAQGLSELVERDPAVELHLLAWSAGALLAAPLVQLLCQPADQAITTGPLAAQGLGGLGLTVASCTLWAPAISHRLFCETLLPQVDAGRVGRLLLTTLTDDAERTDAFGSRYGRSLLYLISNALEGTPHVPGVPSLDGEPLLGLARWMATAAERPVLRREIKALRAAADGMAAAAAEDSLRRNERLAILAAADRFERLLLVSERFAAEANPARPGSAWPAAEWVQTPNPRGAADGANPVATRHDEFLGDAALLEATLLRVLNVAPGS